MHAYCSTFNTSNSAKHCQKYANIYPSQQAEGILSLFEESTASSFCCMRMQGVAGILECSHTPRHCATLRADELSQSAPSVESAVTSTSLLHRSEHLCKHRATAAKHRCWQTVNTPPPLRTMRCFQTYAELSSCAFSSTATEESRWVAKWKKKNQTRSIIPSTFQVER